MSTNLTPIAVQAAAMNVPVPVGKTAAEIIASGFVIPNDVWREDVLRVDTDADKDMIDTAAFGSTTGYHWERHCSWREGKDGLWRKWCGCVRCTVFIPEGHPDTVDVTSATEIRGWVQNRLDIDIVAARKEVELFQKYVSDVISKFRSNRVTWTRL